MLTPPELSALHMPSTGARPTVVPWKVRPLGASEQGVTGWSGRKGHPATRVCQKGTHVSSCVESCGRRAQSPRRHCRKAQRVAFASCVMRL